MPRGRPKKIKEAIIESSLPEEKIIEEKPKDIPFNDLKAVCEEFGIEYREGVTRIHDVAKVLNVPYTPGTDTLEDIIKRYKK